MASRSLSSLQAWPILARVEQFEVFMIAIFIENGKPDDSSDFLKKFVAETLELYEKGLYVREKKYNFKIKTIIADAPAKAFLLNIKGHTGYDSCTKCRVHGATWISRTYFEELHAPQRTCDDFEGGENNPFCHKRSILLDIPNFNPICAIPFDFMHLICLGIMKKLIELWLKSIPNISKRVLKTKQIDILNNRIKAVASFCPMEFVRKPRKIDEFRRWKATEFRTFLFYYGPAVVDGLLPEENLQHFRHLQYAIRLLFINQKSDKIEQAQKIIEIFISSYNWLYHKSLINHNLHGLIHFAQDCLRLGSPELFSAFPFENFLAVLKKLFRSRNLPQMQIINRYFEILEVKEAKTKEETRKLALSHPHKIDHKEVYSSSEIVNAYQQLHVGNFTLRCDRDADSFCKLNDGSLIKIKKFIEEVNPSTNESKIYIIGLKFKNVNSLYDIPWASSEVGVYKAKNLQRTRNTYKIQQFQKKCFGFPCSNEKTAYILVEML